MIARILQSFPLLLVVVIQLAFLSSSSLAASTLPWYEEDKEIVHFHKNADCTGDTYEPVLTSPSQCQNLPVYTLDWRNMSLNTNTKCIALYDSTDCLGEPIAVYSATPRERCRAIKEFGRTFRSVRRCENKASAGTLEG